MKQFITAWQFLTIIPLSRRMEVTAESLGKSMAFFPLIGLVLGGILVALDYGFSRLFAQPVVSAILLISYVGMYGGFHLDGLADTVDGLAGGNDKGHILEIMKDSSVGAIGVVALILLLILKYTAITSLPEAVRWKGLLLMPVIGRWCQVWMTLGSHYARESGLGKAFVDYVKSREIVIATAVVAVASWLTFGIEGMAIVGAVAVFGYLMKSFFHKRVGGVTGDILGAGSELSEVLVLLIVIGWV